MLHSSPANAQPSSITSFNSLKHLQANNYQTNDQRLFVKQLSFQCISLELILKNLVFIRANTSTAPPQMASLKSSITVNVSSLILHTTASPTLSPQFVYLLSKYIKRVMKDSDELTVYFVNRSIEAILMQFKSKNYMVRQRIASYVEIMIRQYDIEHLMKVQRALEVDFLLKGIEDQSQDVRRQVRLCWRAYYSIDDSFKERVIELMNELRGISKK